MTSDLSARDAIASRPRHRRLSVLIGGGIAVIAACAVLAWALGPWGRSGFVEFRMPAATDIPVGIAVAGDGTVWFTMDSSHAIGRLKNGVIEKVRKPGESIEPLGLAADSDGAAWYTDAPKRVISRVTSDGTITAFDLAIPVARLGRLAVAPDGAVWFAEPSAASVTRLKDGIFTRFPMSSVAGLGGGLVAPFGIAVDGHGAVWATLQSANKLVRLEPGKEPTAFELPTRGSAPGDVAVDAAGTVWVLEVGANKVARFAGSRFEEFAIPTPRAGLTALAVAPDGAAWFTELRAHRLGRVQNRVVREFPLPRGDARPFGIAVDRANNVWYTDLSGWIGMLRADRARRG